MMKMQTWLAMAALAAGMSLGSTNLWAQAQDNTGGNGGRPDFRSTEIRALVAAGVADQNLYLPERLAWVYLDVYEQDAGKIAGT